MRDLSAVQDQFIAEWGALGTHWGVTRTMAQIQALLMTSTEPLNTDQIMERLAISRGNAHGGLKELMHWGLVQKVHLKGDRKEYFQTEKDPWRIFAIVARERRKREIQPLVALLHQCVEETKGPKDEAQWVFHEQVKALADFAQLGDAAMHKVASLEKSQLSRWLLRLVKAVSRKKPGQAT